MSPVEALTLPAFATAIDETLTLGAPVEWHERIRALAPKLAYGPSYDRQVVYLLRSMSEAIRTGHPDHALSRLEAAERLAGTDAPKEPTS